MDWEIDKKTGIARLGDCEVRQDGVGVIKLASANIATGSAALVTPDGNPAAPVREGDYLTVPFRVLSAVLIEGWWLDLTDEKMLQAGVPLFDRVTVFGNHQPDVHEWIGVMMKPHWTPALGATPAGVNADFKIDAVENPRIAKGLMMDPPAINAASVQFHFSASRSHADMGWEFYENLGREVDGQIVRFIVNRIRRVTEVSLVYAGADPNARRLSVPGWREETEDEGMDRETEELLKKLKVAEAGVAELATLKKEMGDVPMMAYLSAKKWHDDELAKRRTATLASYQQLKGDKKKPEMEALIGSADLAQLAAFADEYNAELEALHPAKCAKCGSTDVSRAQSLSTPPEGDNIPDETIDISKYRVG